MILSECLNSPSRLHLGSTAIFLCIELDDRMTELVASGTTAPHNDRFSTLYSLSELSQLFLEVIEVGS